MDRKSIDDHAAALGEYIDESWKALDEATATDDAEHAAGRRAYAIANMLSLVNQQVMLTRWELREAADRLEAALVGLSIK